MSRRAKGKPLGRPVYETALGRRESTYKRAVERLLDMGVDVDKLILRITEIESGFTNRYERHWYAAPDLNGEISTGCLHICQPEIPLSFRLSDLCKYRSLLKP